MPAAFGSAQPMMMGGQGMAFGGPQLGGAMKKSMRFAIIMMVVTTVPIAIIMAAVFVDWSAIIGDDGAPKGGWCKGAARCCKVVHGAAPDCDKWKDFPGSGCKSVYEGYEKAAKGMGKTCK